MPADVAESSTDRLLGAPPIGAAFAAATARRLRILAYHGVPDPATFRAHLDHLRSRYRPVSGAQVAAAFSGGPALPPRAVWVTFDDGRADVVDDGLPELRRAGVPATLFVCPGLIEERRPFWWDIVTGSLDAAGAYEYEGRTWTDRGLVTRLKQVPDPERRRVLADLESRTPDAGDRDRVLTRGQLDEWLAAGHEIGNHTWDHPCLDQCEPEEQAAQVARAHEALTAMTGTAPTLFAYPNGDWADAAERELRRLGYGIGLLFDHRLAAPSQQPLRLSRLRIDSDAPPRRTTAIVSGAHSTLFQARRAVSERRGGRG
jgi:peptidoglycan/xylan/chitin deacetylase (PgdA/CDA1 family)